MHNISDPNISSAEMTAYWRALFPQFSKDLVSIKLASPAGIEKSKEFEKKYSYPLVGRKVSVRAGFILENILRLLSSGKYDSCISFASGFSLLTYIVAQKLAENEINNIAFIDTDLPNIIKERKVRIDKLVGRELSEEINNKIKMISVDLEAEYKANHSFKVLFSECKRPLFIVEGIIYFLSQDCVKWIIHNTADYANSAIIFDYWPDDGIMQSTCFKRVVDSLKGFIPENIKSFWDKTNVAQLKASFSVVADHRITDIEKGMSQEQGEPSQFINQNDFFPVKFIIAEKNI